VRAVDSVGDHRCARDEAGLGAQHLWVIAPANVLSDADDFGVPTTKFVRELSEATPPVAGRHDERREDPCTVWRVGETKIDRDETETGGVTADRLGNGQQRGVSDEALGRIDDAVGAAARVHAKVA